MTRPLLQKSILELEDLFKSARGHVSTLVALSNELKHRSTPKAASLQKLVNAAIAGAGTPFNRTGAQPTLKPTSIDPDDDVKNPKKAVSTKPAAPAKASIKVPMRPAARATHRGSNPGASFPSSPSSRSPASSVPVPSATNPEPTSAPPARNPVVSSAMPATQGDAKITLTEKVESLSVEEAYRVLKCTPGSRWEIIEQCRRDMVQQAHPSNLSKLNVEQRLALTAQAKKANCAYAILFAMRLK